MEIFSYELACWVIDVTQYPIKREISLAYHGILAARSEERDVSFFDVSTDVAVSRGDPTEHFNGHMAGKHTCQAIARHVVMKHIPSMGFFAERK
jgi:hypothetical protein